MEHDTQIESIRTRDSILQVHNYIIKIEKELDRLEKENNDLHFRILELELEKKIPKFIEIAN